MTYTKTKFVNIETIIPGLESNMFSSEINAWRELNPEIKNFQYTLNELSRNEVQVEIELVITY